MPPPSFPDTAVVVDRRRVTDRRSVCSSSILSVRPGGRRSGFRRRDEGAKSYVDRPRPIVLAMVLFIVIASGFDAYATLVLLQKGAAEANPVMDVAIASGAGWFVGIKMLMTVVGAVFLAMHQQFYLGIRALGYLCTCYMMLLAYHASLLALKG